MGHTQWAAARADGAAHAIIDGDTVTLCGKLAEEHAVVVEVSTEQARGILRGIACPECVAITRELAEVVGDV